MDGVEPPFQFNEPGAEDGDFTGAVVRGGGDLIDLHLQADHLRAGVRE